MDIVKKILRDQDTFVKSFIIVIVVAVSDSEKEKWDALVKHKYKIFFFLSGNSFM